MESKSKKLVEVTLTGPEIILLPEIEKLSAYHPVKVTKKKIMAGGYPEPACCSSGTALK